MRITIAGIMFAFGVSQGYAAVLTSSTFDNPGDGVDGWTVVGDGSAPSYIAAGGNPGGYISTTDQATGLVVYWVAPAKFLGNKSAAFAGKLTFDLRQSTTDNQFTITTANPLVRLIGNGVVLNLVGTRPETAFTSYSVDLSEAGGWTSGGAPASDAQIQNVLANLTSVSIRAEFAAIGGDVDDLDNVAILSADTQIPEPSTAGLLVLGLMILAAGGRLSRLFLRS